MQFPINTHLAGKEISTHLVMEILGIFIGVRYYYYLKKNTKDLISPVDRLKIFAAVCFGALIGSRLVGVFEDPNEFFNSENKFVYIFSNKTIVGGLLGGLISVEITKKIIGVTASSGDMMTYPVLLGLMIGRIGCFCEGLADATIGRATTCFTGIDFGDHVLRHPLPLYEIAFLFLLWISIRLLEKYQLADGAKFKMFMISYFSYRFMIEFLKEDHFTVFHISILQLTCILGLLCYCKTLLNPKKLFLSYA
ncbi:MAG: prolipoprotein diacylglyceryl transferase [Bacteroidetes bacterium]|nr:prolipoprotein diacylglyceryl transferase [Bacteroidota bacterium]